MYFFIYITLYYFFICIKMNRYTTHNFQECSFFLLEKYIGLDFEKQDRSKPDTEEPRQSEHDTK